MECRLENITVNYETYGQGRPLILLPGWTMSARTHAHIMEPLLQNRGEWQRFYIDPPGHGRTPGVEWITCVDQMVEVLLACIDRLIPGQNFAIHGYSMGAYQARAILYHRPTLVDGVSMLAPAVVAEHGRRKVPEFNVLIEDPRVIASLSDEEREVMESMVVRSRGMLEQMRAWPRLAEGDESDYEFLEPIHEDPTRYSCSFDIDAPDRSFDKPALIMTGRQDASVGYKDAWRLMDNYPRATFVVFDRAGHFMEEKDVLIGQLVNEWLDRVEESLS